MCVYVWIIGFIGKWLQMDDGFFFNICKRVSFTGVYSLLFHLKWADMINFFVVCLSESSSHEHWHHHYLSKLNEMESMNVMFLV